MKSRMNSDQYNRRLLKKKTGGLFLETLKRGEVKKKISVQSRGSVVGVRVNAGRISQRPDDCGTVPLVMMERLQQTVRAER